MTISPISPGYHARMTVWTEIGDRVFVRRYEFFDQNIGVVMGGDDVMVIDTRSTHVQASRGRSTTCAS